MSAMTRSKPLESISAEINATPRETRSSFATSNVALRLLASAIAAASCGQCACRFPPRQILRSVRHGGSRDAPHRLALRLDPQSALALLGGGHLQIADK